jgi:hypothetical protein
MSITSGLTAIGKRYMLSAGHCCLTPKGNLSCAGVSGQFTLTSLPSTADIAVGEFATGSGIATGAIVSEINGNTGVTLSKPHTAAVTAASFNSDRFKLLLLKAGPTGTYDSTLTNVGTPGTGSPSTSNVGTDEASGAGYTPGGIALDNVSPVSTNPASSAAITFSTTIQLTNATLSTDGAVIFNSTARIGAASGPVAGVPLSIHAFTGTQSVANGTFTLNMPTPVDGQTGLIRIN